MTSPSLFSARPPVSLAGSARTPAGRTGRLVFAGPPNTTTALEAASSVVAKNWCRLADPSEIVQPMRSSSLPERFTNSTNSSFSVGLAPCGLGR